MDAFAKTNPWFLCAALLLASVDLSAALAAQPIDLRCEYRINPLGIGMIKPRLSWVVSSTNPAARGVRQTAYRILVSSTSHNLLQEQGDLWDTGKVLSSNSIQVSYTGKPLPSGSRVFWRVQIWDEKGEPSTWSPAAFWSRALDSADWKAKWIGHDEQNLYKDPDSSFRFLLTAHWIQSASNTLQTSLDVPEASQIETATAVIGTDPGFELFLDGKLVGHGATVGSPEIWDIKRYLKSGPNAVSIVPDPSKKPVATIAAFHIALRGSSPIDLVSNAHWSGVTDLGAYGMAPWGEVGFEEARALPGRLIRKEFSAKKDIDRATAYVAGLGLSELYLNGSKVGDQVLSPNLTDYDKHVQFVTYDITSQLRAGKNAVGLMLGNGRYWAPRLKIPIPSRSFGYPKALVQIQIDYRDGSSATVVSDQSWKLSTDGPIRANNEYDGETYDARAEQFGWAEPGFKDKNWKAADLVAAPSGELVSQEAEPLRVVETLQPVKVTQLHPGIFIYDMGQNMVGWCRLNVKGPAGTAITLRHAETLTDDGELYTANLRSARATDIYTLRGGGGETYEPRFTYHGFRFVEVRGYPGTPDIHSLEGRVVHDSMEQTADFTSSDAMLNQIHHNVFWGVRGNYRSIPTDCPQRDERQGWLGDRSVVCRSETYLFNVAAFYSKWERDLSDSQSAEGTIPDVSPNYWKIYSDDVTWPSTFLQVPAMLYDQYADLSVIERYYQPMRRWIAHMTAFLKDGLLNKDTFADWCVPPEDPKLVHSKDPARQTSGALLATAYFYRMNQQMARFARLLGKETEAADYERTAAEIKAAFNNAYFHPDTAIYGNGTQTASILPLAFGMVEPEAQKRVFDALVANIETKSDGHVATGLVGVQWLMRTLTENGRPDLALQVATQPTYPGWGYMVSQGATTVWELWNGNTAEPSMNSGNHVMQIGDLGLWMYEDLAGIRADPENPGFRHTLIHPYPTPKLTNVKASHKSLYGLIGSAWRRENGTLHLDVIIPPNTTATIWVPAKELAGITEGEKEASTADGVKFVRMDPNAAVFNVESGSYHFAAPSN